MEMFLMIAKYIILGLFVFIGSVVITKVVGKFIKKAKAIFALKVEATSSPSCEKQSTSINH